MTHWTTLLAQQLQGPLKPRAYPLIELRQLALAIRPTLTQLYLQKGLQEMTLAGQLQKINNALYVNLGSIPKPSAADAAGFLRKGAVISLHSTLGEYGVLNNPSRVITAVVPLLKHSANKPILGPQITSTGVAYHFYGLPEALFYNLARGDDWEDFFSQEARNQGTPRATPEKALLDYVYLGYSVRSKLPPLPMDIDLSDLNVGRLRRLSKQTSVEPLLERFMVEYSKRIPKDWNPTKEEPNKEKKNSALVTPAHKPKRK